MFEFNIDNFVTLAQFQEITKVDFEDLENMSKFIQENTIFKLNVIQFENDQGWRQLAMEMLTNLKESGRGNTICVNDIPATSMFADPAD